MSYPFYDYRVTPVRADLAAASLRGLIRRRDAEGTLWRVVAPSAPLRRRPAADAPLETEVAARRGGDRVRRSRWLELGAAFA